MKLSRLSLFFICITLVFGTSCRKIGKSNSTFRTITFAPAAPPTSGAAGANAEAPGLGLGGMGSCVWNKELGKMVCTDEFGKVTMKTKEQLSEEPLPDDEAKTDPKKPAPVEPNVIPDVQKPTVDANSEKWYVGDKSSYYQQVSGSDYWQHFGTNNEPTGWYINRKTNQMVKPSQFKLDSSTKNMVLGESDDIYSMSQEKGGWKGAQQVYRDGKLQPSGMAYYYGNFQRPKGIDEKSNFKPGWGQLYEINTDEYRRVNPNAAILNDLEAKNKNGRIILDGAPQNFQSNQNMNYYEPSILESVWTEITQDLPNSQPQPNISNRQQPPSVRPQQQGRQNSGQKLCKDFLLHTFVSDCGPCDSIAKPLAAQYRTRVKNYTMGVDQTPGGRSLPLWEYNGQFVSGPEGCVQ